MDLELEIFRNLFVSIAEEMGVVLRRTAFSSNIKERRDYSCAIYDADAETIAMGDHMPVHLGAMPESVREALAAHALEPGDVVFRINHRQIERPQQFMAVWQALPGRKAVVVEVLRRGRPKVINVPIVDPAAKK